VRHPYLKIHGTPHMLELAGQQGRGRATAHLRGRPDRHVDQYMGRARCCLFREDRRDQLTLAVQVERPFHTDQDVVRRAQPNGAAPDHAATGAFHNALDVRHVEVHGRKRFHGVGRAGGRGDGTR
jgi:hypothetical protein